MTKRIFNLISTFQTTFILVFTFTIFFKFYRYAIVPSMSMYPTLSTGEFLLYSYNKDFNYGDILLFRPFDNDETVFVKRMIGKDTDVIEIKEGNVYRNGKKIRENYISEQANYLLEDFIVPNESYFMLGDNRNNSVDSHIIGTIPKEKFIGKVIFHIKLF